MVQQRAQSTEHRAQKVQSESESESGSENESAGRRKFRVRVRAGARMRVRKLKVYKVPKFTRRRRETRIWNKFVVI